MKVAIIGGGASGMVAAIVAQSAQCEVSIFEREDRLGKKILITGNGRCNITNSNLDLSHFHSLSPDFVEHALKRFDLEKTRAFFAELGIIFKQIGERIYPLSLQASSVAELLHARLKELGVKIELNSPILAIEHEKKGFRLQSDTHSLFFDRVLIATGSKAHVKPSHDGYNFATHFGHTLTPMMPSLVQLHSPNTERFSGVRTDALATLFIDNQAIQHARGDVLFTRYGLSGNAILDISKNASQALFYGQKVRVCINLFPEFSKASLQTLLTKQSKIAQEPKKLLLGIVHTKLINPLLEQAGIERLSAKSIHKLLYTLQHFWFEISDTNGFKSAEVVSGGVSTFEVNEKTMESKLIKGLFFAGELLDVDGDCGGYNLQWAWASGALAGEHLQKRA